LRQFGSFKSELRATLDEDEIETEDLEIDIKLTDHIPELLPIYGKRVNVWYPGIPKQCNKCFDFNHVYKECTKEKVPWLDYVAKVLRTGVFKEKLFGTWIETLSKYHPDYQPKTRDLRAELEANKRGLNRGDLRRHIGVNPEADARQRIGNETRGHPRGQRGYRRPRGGYQHRAPYYQREYQHEPNQEEEFPEQPPRGRGRGGYRGRGTRRPRGRGWNQYY